MNLGSLEGKARLAERAKPYLASIPDGAFRDLMQQRLTELTGVGARVQAAPQAPATPSMRPSRGTAAPKRSLVRTAIALLLQQPSLVKAIEPPYLFGELHQPGISLLVELIDLIRERPDIGTGAILAHFAEREESAALNKLAMIDMLMAPENWTHEFVGALKSLDLETLRQRETELNQRQSLYGMSSLSAAEKDELRNLQPNIRRLEAELRQLSNEAK